VTALPPLPLARAGDLVARMAHVRVVVVGDVMLDQFIVGRVTRISPEAPVPVVAHGHDEYRAGGAANVALNVRALGAGVDLIGLVGADSAADRLRELLLAAGVSSGSLIVDEGRRTTLKVRVVTTRNQQVARVDYEDEEPASMRVEQAVGAQVAARVPAAQVLVVSDYLKGVITRGVMSAAVSACRDHGVPLLVDPKIPHLDLYAGATLVTPNHFEAETAAHLRIRTDADAQQAAVVFRERARCEGVLITRGEHGMWLACGNIEGSLAATAREVADVTGAGDTVIATLALAFAAGASPTEAAHLANRAAGVVVGKFGPATVTAQELLAAVREA
jgi:rfaE bifunctional protein kinase chain/domain